MRKDIRHKTWDIRHKTCDRWHSPSPPWNWHGSFLAYLLKTVNKQFYHFLFWSRAISVFISLNTIWLYLKPSGTVYWASIKKLQKSSKDLTYVHILNPRITERDEGWKFTLKCLTIPVHIQTLLCHLSDIHDSFKDIQKRALESAPSLSLLQEL